MNKIKVQKNRPIDFKCTSLDGSKLTNIASAQSALNEISYVLRMIKAKRIVMITSECTVEAYDNDEYMLPHPNLDWISIFKVFREANMDFVQMTVLKSEADLGDKVAECFLYETPGSALAATKISEAVASSVIEIMMHHECGRLCISRDGSDVEYLYEDEQRRLVTSPQVHSFVENLFKVINERIYVDSLYATVPEEFYRRYRVMDEPTLKAYGIKNLLKEEDFTRNMATYLKMAM